MFLLTQVEWKEQKKIAIFAPKEHSGFKHWDPESIFSGVPGSQEAVIYVAENLAKLNYAVTVFGDPPPFSRHSSKGVNPRYLDSHVTDETFFDIAIIWRAIDTGISWKQRAQKIYFWPHDICRKKVEDEIINSFTDVLWLSKWQRKQWLSFNPEMAKFETICGNGIDPRQFQPITERANPHSCIYGSNYGRGLKILLNIWPTIRQYYPKATLDIYYGWKHWGEMSSDEESLLRKQIMSLQSEGVNEHGLVSHKTLNQAYAKASLWTYPCIKQETFCITALRAQLNGTIPVIIEGSALDETVRSGYKCKNQIDYLNTLLKALSEAEKTTLEQRVNHSQFVLEEFTWNQIALRWKSIFDKK